MSNTLQWENAHINTFFFCCQCFTLTYDARRKGDPSTGKSPKKKTPVSQWVEGFRRCFRSKDKGFPNFLLLSVRFQCFSNLLLHCQIKTPFGPNLPLTEKRGVFLDYFWTTFLASVIYHFIFSLLQILIMQQTLLKRMLVSNIVLDSRLEMCLFF